MASQATDPDREYRLIEQLELRIASASTTEKLEAILQKFLAALLLKLASENARNRNLTIKICQYVNQRLKIDNTIGLPVQSLLKTFREAENAFVKRFALIFVEQGLSRLQAADAKDMLPAVLRWSVPGKDDLDPSDAKMWSIAFDFLLGVLEQWQIPHHTSNEDLDLRRLFALSETQCTVLSRELSYFLLFDPKASITTGVRDDDFRLVFEKQFKRRQNVVLPIIKFLFTSIFADTHRLLPATILSVDANASASSLADAMFKQCNFDLETEQSVDTLYDLFNIAKPRLQTRIMTLLTRSQRSTERASTILAIVEKHLFQTEGGLEAAKLRAAIFTYLNWAVRVSKTLSSVRAELQAALREFIEQQGWPIAQATSLSEVDLRAKAYEGIGLLETTWVSGTPRADQQSLLNLITWLFTSLRCDTTRDVRSSIDESLSRILNVTDLVSPEDVRTLKQLLLWNVTASEGDEDPLYFLPTKTSTRFIAVRFANKALPFADTDARFIDLLAHGLGENREIAEEATRGLDPHWHSSNIRLAGIQDRDGSIAFPSFDDLVETCFLSHTNDPALFNSTAIMSSTILFLRNLLVTEALRDTRHDVRDETEWRTKIDALVGSDKSVREILRKHLTSRRQNTLLAFMENALNGLALGSTTCAEIALELAGLVPDDTLSKLGRHGLVLCRDAVVNAATQPSSARLLGILASLSDSGLEITTQAVSQCRDWSETVGLDAVRVRGHLLSAAFTVSRYGLRQSTLLSNVQVDDLAQLVSTILLNSRDKALVNAAYIALGQLSMCLPQHHLFDVRFDEISKHLLAEAKKENETAATALGRLLNANYSESNTTRFDAIIDQIFTLHENRKAEFHFAIGEALAIAALGFHSSSTMAELDVNIDTPNWGLHAGVFKAILDRCIEGCRHTKPSLKKASAIWLLCLIQFCDVPELLKQRLRECQAAFTRLLTDRDEVVQEAGSRGLGLVFEQGDSRLQEDLIRDLVQSFTAGSVKMSGTVTEDTQLFEAGALPTEGGQSVTTYKDIVSLATEMGDPSLVYRFMNLASNNAIWTSRAAFGRFGLSSVLADSTYLTENKSFYPKLFRYRFDPNPNVQKSMNDIWKALVKDSNKVIEENFDIIMTDLLKSIISGKEWRARQASCAAISDLIQGRELDSFEKYLEQIWTVAFKVLDDVKETVRTAAMSLCRTLTNMLIRNLEVGQGTTKRATTMLNHALPFLLQQMEGGAAQEVQQYAVVTLLEVVKKSPPQALQRFAPTILETLILSLSSLEHESINYLHLNADKYGLTAEKLDSMRVSSISASPITDAIERCLESLNTRTDLAEQHDGSTSPTDEAMLRLEKAFKTAIGLPSKIGLSRVMVTLVVRHHAMFRPFADRFVQLTRKYILDRNATISVSFSMALAYLMRLASEREVRDTNFFAQKLYFESQDLSHRAVAGEIIQAVSKVSNDVFMHFATIFLPFAFIGRNDLDEGVRARFDPPWKDNVGGSRSLKLYLTEIVGLIDVHIKSSLWPIRQASCLAVADLISSMETGSDYSTADAKLLWGVLQEALTGKTWTGKEKVVAAYPKFVKQARSIWLEQSNQFEAIAKREAKRTNLSYRQHAILALGEFASVRPDLDLAEMTFEIVSDVVEGLEDEDDAMDVQDGDGPFRQRLVEETWAAVVKCAFQVLSERTNPSVLELAVNLVSKAHQKHDALIEIEIYHGATRFMSQVAIGSSSSRLVAQDQIGQARGEEDQAEVHDQHTRQEDAATRNARLAAFLHQLALALLVHDSTRHASESEKIRQSRVDFAGAAVRCGFLASSTCQLLTPVLDEWSRSERSRPVKADLEKTIDLLARSGSSRP